MWISPEREATAAGRSERCLKPVIQANGKITTFETCNKQTKKENLYSQ